MSAVIDPLDSVLAARESILARSDSTTLPRLRRVDFDRFADALGDVAGVEALRATDPAGRAVAPLMYVPSVLDWGDGNSDVVGDDGLGWWDAPGTQGLAVHTMHGGQRLVFIAPIHEDDVLTRHRRFVAVDDKRGHSGRFIRITKRSTFERDGEPVLDLTEDILVRAADDGAAAPEQGAGEASDPSEPRAADVERRPSRLQAVRFSQVTGNTHLIHLDAAYAAQEGFTGPVVHSSIHGGQLLMVVTRSLDSFGSSAVIERFQWRNVVPASFGTTFYCTGDVVGADGEIVEVDLIERSADGAVHATGKAFVNRREDREPRPRRGRES